MLKVGLTGNIASGKSEVEKILQKLNYCVFDLDKTVHYLYQNDEKIKNLILQKFSTLDRKKIGDIVFSNPQKKLELENIIYPRLKELIFELFEEYKNEKYIFISGALLFESGFNKYFDKIIFIDAPYELRLKRLIKRNNLSQDEAKKRINAQDNSNKDRADVIIQNLKDINSLEKETIKALELL